jgi:hypothetical protein
MLTPDFTVIQAAIIEVKCPQGQLNDCQSLPADSGKAAKKLPENFIELMWERLALIRGNHKMPGDARHFYSKSDLIYELYFRCTQMS